MTETHLGVVHYVTERTSCGFSKMCKLGAFHPLGNGVSQVCLSGVSVLLHLWCVTGEFLSGSTQAS